MSDQRPVPPSSTADRAPALRQAGALPLRPGDPDRIGPYVPLGLLGSGGMGRVYLARPTDGGPDLVAVKVIRPEYAEDVRFRRRFEQEAAVHSRIRTPRMPRLAGTGFRDDVLWMATEYLPGLDLSAAVDEDGPLTAAAVRRLVAELGQALADLSAAGIVHRDLKPSNVLLSAQGAHVIDFGIAKAADASAITGTGNRVGTPAYMSPEYLRTGECDTASDVFSLACTLVFATIGRAPFGDGTGVDVMHRVAFEEPNPDVLTEIADADPGLAALLRACLAKEPGRRPTPGQLIEAAASDSWGAWGTEAVAYDFPPADAARGTGADGPSGTFDWPEPLAGRVLARQRACETLRRVPLEQPGPRPAAKAAAGADASPGPSSDASAQPLPATASGGRARRKRLLIGAAGLAACLAAAGAVSVLLSPSTTEASPRKRTTTSADARPGDSVPVPASESADRAGAAPDGGSGASEVSDEEERSSADGDTPRPGASTSGSGSGADDPSATDPSVPGPGTSAPDAPSPAPPEEPTEPASPAWLTDCTYYYGSGVTRPGDSGDRVRQVQCMLSKRGYSVGPGGVSGEFDAGTKAAVQSFQQARQLVVKDGTVRPRVWKALRSAN